MIYCEKVSELFGLSGDEIAQRMENFYNDNSDAEKKSWRASLPKLIEVIQSAGLGNLYIATEYELPAGGRIDAALIGDDDNGKHRVLVIELKQWSRDGIEYYANKGFPAIKVNATNPYLSRHPVNQTKEYTDALIGNHSNVVNGQLSVSGCQYLHEFELGEKNFFIQDRYSDIDISMMFVKGEEKVFADYLKSVFSPFTDNELARNLFIEGDYVTTEMDMEIINRITESPDNIPLWHDQSKILDYIMPLLKQQAEGKLRTKHMIVIAGAAGTGKTVLLTHLVASILKERPETKVGVVVQPNWEKTGENIFKIYGMNSRYLSVTTATKIITGNERYDVIIVDEAHKLSRKYGKQHPSFGQVYKIPGFEDCNSHLEILQKMGKQIILMYDVLQAIRPANITREMFQQLTAGYEKKFLHTQFRIQAPKEKSYTSDDYVNGIKYLLYKDTGLLASDLTNYNPDFNRDVFRDKSEDAYFGYFTGKPMHQLIDWIEEDRNFHAEHINRVLSGMFCCSTADKWSSTHGKDPSITHFHEDGLNRRWNSTQENWINIGDEDAEDQIGSVFAVQGIDLNKVGVMIGPDIRVNEDGKLEAVPDNHNNTNNKFSVEEMTDPMNQFEFTLYILNQYYVLLTRGIDGIRLGFWDGNDSFRKYMEDTLDIGA